MHVISSSAVVALADLAFPVVSARSEGEFGMLNVECGVGAAVLRAGCSLQTDTALLVEDTAQYIVLAQAPLPTRP